MKMADFVDKTAQNPLLSMKTPDFVDKVAAVLGRRGPLRPQGPFRLCAEHHAFLLIFAKLGHKEYFCKL